jgi:ABC-type transport system substrate-binding protein
LLKKGAIPTNDVLDIGIQVAEALEYSHMRGIVHRDIKPENVLITSEPQGLRARVTDFGLARTTQDQRITSEDVVVGTIAYLCPEAVSGKDSDARSDIYSLGVMLYECLSGRTPYLGDIRSILFSITYEDPPQLKEVATNISEELNAVIMHCLRRVPSLRPQRAQDVADQLSRLRYGRSAWEFPARSGRREATVGRTHEYAELVRRLEAAAEGQGQLVLIGGDAGVGKTFLVDQLTALARARRVPVYRGRFHERDRAFPFQGFCEVCQDFLRGPEAAGSGSNVSGIDFSDLSAELTSLFPSLAEPNVFMFPTPEQFAEFETVPDIAVLHDLLARTLIRFSENGPAIVVLEDLHHGGEATTSLQPILSRLDRSPMLIIGTYRNNEVTRDHPVSSLIRNLSNEKNFSLIELKPLGMQDHRRLVESLTLNSAPEEEFLDKLYEATEGNPYFTKEVIRSLAESGVLIPFENGRLVVSGDLEMTFDSLPATVQQTIEARMRKLKEPLQEVLSAASVLGKTFESADLVFLLEKDEKVEDAIDALIADGFLEEDRETYRSDRLLFSSAMVRDASYARLSRRRRKAYHKKYAEELERRNENFLERVYPALIHHYSRAGEAEKVVDYGIAFARKTLRTFGTEEVIRALEMVLEFGPGVREGEVRRLMAKAYRIKGEPVQALEEYGKAIQIFQRFGDTHRAVDSMALAAETAWHFRRTEDARVWIEKGIPLARSVGSQLALKKLLSLGATASNLRGDYEAGRLYMRELDRLEKTGPSIIAPNTAGILHVPVSGLVHGLDPSRVFSMQEEETIPLIFEPLTRQGRAAGIRPWLAAEYYAENSGRTFHFRLRENVRFHNGRLLTARDVSYSLHRLVSSNLSRKRHLLSGMKEIQIITDHEFRIHLDKPIAFFPALLADTSCAIVPEGTPRIGFNWKEDCAGTGPFRVTRFEPGKILELEPFLDYWRPGFPKCQKLVYTFGVSPEEILSGFRSGLFSLAWDLHPESVEELLRDNLFSAQYKENPSLSTYYLAFNTNNGIFKDENLRHDFVRSLDVKSLVSNFAGRSAIPAVGLIPPGLLGYEPPVLENPDVVSTDSITTEAVRIADHEINLAGASHPIFDGPYATFRDELFDALKHKGFTVHGITAKSRTDQPPPAHADFEIGRWIADYPDPDGVFYLLLQSEKGLLGKFCGSPELDELIERGRSEINPLARHQHYRQMERYISDHALLLPLFHEQSYRFALKEVQEFEVSYSRPVVPYEKLWIQR